MLWKVYMQLTFSTILSLAYPVAPCKETSSDLDSVPELFFSLIKKTFF